MAEFAREYVALVDGGFTNVIVRLAKELHMSPDGVRSRRRSAVSRGILTPGDSSTGRGGDG
ncbi:MAG: hypothetical protein M3454_18655 [Actinomycetota bacterium]|nr:hypothetical protein [Actinomycetota bacterium]